MSEIQVIHNGSEKAGNKRIAMVDKTVVDHKNKTIEHYVNHVMVDADGDIIDGKPEPQVIKLSEDSYEQWINQQMKDATVDSVDAVVNPVVEE